MGDGRATHFRLSPEGGMKKISGWLSMVSPSQSMSLARPTGWLLTQASAHRPQARHTVRAMGRYFIRVRWASSREPSRSSCRMPARSTPAGQVAWQAGGSSRLPPMTEPAGQGFSREGQALSPASRQGAPCSRLGQRTSCRSRAPAV